MNLRPVRALLSVAAVLPLALAAGCAAPGHHTPQVAPRTDLPIFRGEDGAAMTWDALMRQVAASDVVIIGEQHDDAVAHRVELAIVQDTLKHDPRAALSMEMLDRRYQSTVDDYLAGLIDRTTFVERTASTRWLHISDDYLAGKIKRKTFAERIHRFGWPDWMHNYQPIIDAAKSAGARVVAANTPWRLYTSLGNKHGYARLDELTPAQQALFDRPAQILTGKYRERFWDVIAGHPEGQAPPKASDDAEQGVHPGLNDKQVLGMFRGQLLMDATMAASIARALSGEADKVVHLVGQFHCDFAGGTVQELRRRAPAARVMVVSCQRRDGTKLDPEDRGRADVVIYTGPPQTD